MDREASILFLALQFWNKVSVLLLHEEINVSTCQPIFMDYTCSYACVCVRVCVYVCVCARARVWRIYCKRYVRIICLWAKFRRSESLVFLRSPKWRSKQLRPKCVRHFQIENKAASFTQPHEWACITGQALGIPSRLIRVKKLQAACGYRAKRPFCFRRPGHERIIHT